VYAKAGTKNFTLMEIATNLAHTAFSFAMGRESELRPVSIKSVYITRNLQAYENDTKPKSNYSGTSI